MVRAHNMALWAYLKVESQCPMPRTSVCLVRLTSVALGPFMLADMGCVGCCGWLLLPALRGSVRKLVEGLPRPQIIEQRAVWREQGAGLWNPPFLSHLHYVLAEVQVA